MDQFLLKQLKTEFKFKGDLDHTPATLKAYSRDASLFEIKPQLVAYPKDTADVQALVKFVNRYSPKYPGLSLTARAGGTDMSGGAINHSIIIDLSRYLNKVIEVTADYAVVQAGCYYRDLEKETLKHKRLMPSYPASRELCSVGGMVANNSGGEKTIKYGKTEDQIRSLKMVLSDGSVIEVKPLTVIELAAKKEAPGLEGQIYRELGQLIDDNYEAIMAAKPDVPKNSSGYYLWNVYNKTTSTFDLCRLIVGSQGTLGIVTEITFKLWPVEPYAGMLVIFLPDLGNLSQVINEILPFKPDSLESYDDHSLKLAVKFSFDFFKQLGLWQSAKLGWQFIPETWAVLTAKKLPRLILLVEFTGQSEAEIENILAAVERKIAHFKYRTKITKNHDEAEKYWRIRRESFNLLRKHVRGRRTAPFIDDIVVKPEYLPEFLPRLQKIIDEYKLLYTIAGHPGDGNFHIIPLMDLSDRYSADIILELSDKVYELVKEYKGSITAEHNDGIIRTPYLRQEFGDLLVDLFRQTKKLFDPGNIFNPGKKVGGTFDDIRKYLIKSNR